VKRCNYRWFKCLCSLLQNVMEQFNPGLRNLVILGKNYEKSVTAMILSGKAYFDAVSKIGENAIVSPVSRELGESPAGPASFKRFQREIITELEKKTEMDVKYMNATFKRYQSEHKMKQDSLDRSQLDLKKLRRKSQGKNSSKYEIRENEYLETISCRQMDMQKFIADGCKEALLEEKRRFCFLADKHCMFSYQTSNFHEKAKEVLSLRLPGWQEKCSDVSQVPDTVATMIEKLSTPEQSPQVQHYNRNNVGSVVPPPAPPLKAQTSPLANMFNPEIRSPLSSSLDRNSDQGSLGECSLSRSTSQSSGLNMSRRSRVRTIFPHTAGNNSTLLSFDHGDIITLLLQEEKDVFLYCLHGTFYSSINANEAEFCSKMTILPEQQELEQEDEDGPVLLPPPDYSDHSPSGPAVHCAPSPSPSPSPQNTVSVRRGSRFGGGNPFATVKLRPTVTNDRSAPLI
uniref:BAR/IMD domain containing adaptor protein 2 like 1a n=1 Tax=Salarias fasciatus TaxID=181472 RepID=A0A672H1H4_SALFA